MQIEIASDEKKEIEITTVKSRALGAICGACIGISLKNCYFEL